MPFDCNLRYRHWFCAVDQVASPACVRPVSARFCLPPPPPRLLVSVANEEEALAAMEGGADVVDLKDPARGSLGAADPAVITRIARIPSFSQGIPLTAALGEVRERVHGPVFSVPANLAFAKLGLAGLGTEPMWRCAWNQVRSRFDEAAGRPLNWVAVGYVDSVIANSPPLEQIVEAADQPRVGGVLLDTFGKAEGRLLDFCSERQIELLADDLHARSQFLAIAGRLRITDFARLKDLPVDLVAVRSAVCLEENRLSRVCAGRVQACVEALSRPAAVTSAC